VALHRGGRKFTILTIKYNLDDHLGSSNVLVDENGTLVNREEYYPFGETSFSSYAKKNVTASVAKKKTKKAACIITEQGIMHRGCAGL
jgi:hypothetical protein